MSKEVRFFLIPPKEINDLALGLAKKYAAQYDHDFFVDNQFLFFHITLFRGEVPGDKLEDLNEQVAVSLAKQPAFELSVDGLWTHKGGWLGLNVRPKQELEEFKLNLAKRLKAQTIFRDKGYEDPNYAFDPHITLLRLRREGLADELIVHDKIPIQSFTADSVGIGLSDGNGQVYKVIKEFKLGKG